MRQAAHNSGRLAATPLALLLLLVVAADISAAPLPTVGIGGALRLGFGGALRRAGIPFDYLTTAEQCDPDALRRYDLVLMADLMERYEPWRDDAMLALDSYVMGGGRLLCQPGARLPRAMAGWKIEERWPPGWPPVTEPRSFRLVDGAHPFLHCFPPRRRWDFTGRVGPVELRQPAQGRVLARFSGPAVNGPAIVARACGPGRLLYLGADIAYMQGNWTAAYDDLILGAVHYLSDGRLTAQWASVPPPANIEAVAPDEPQPAGPRAGELHLGRSPPDGYALRVPLALRRPACRLALERVGAREINLNLSPAHATVSVGGATPRRIALPGNLEVVLHRTAGELRLVINGAAAQRFAVPWRPDGECFASRELSFQPLEALWLTDDFARLGRPGGPWRRRSGRWLCGGPPRPESRISGFALRGWRGEVQTGEWFWGDRAVAVAVYPRSAQAIRLDLARWDAAHALELQLPVGHGQGRLVRRAGRRVDTVLGGLGCLVPYQWSRITGEILQGEVRIAIDGRERRAPLPAGALGGLGLAVTAGDALFDDFQAAEPGPEPLPLIHPARYDRGDEGLLDHDTWAHPAAAWLPTREPGTFWHVGLFAGDLELRLPVQRRGLARLAIYASAERTTGQPLVQLGERHLSSGDTVVLARRDGRWLAHAGGRPVPVATQPAGAVGLGLRAAGLALDPASLELRAAEVSETVFERAPTAWWQSEGDWSVSSRWPCMPEWAWLSGAGQPRAVLWGKSVIRGDVVVEAWLGVRMMGRYATHEGEPFEGLRLTIAGDGRGPRSGYVLELGSDAQGYSRLYRRKELVASVARDLACPREVHNFWGGVRFERRGARLTAWYQNRLLLTYTDPAPLPDGQVALWTEDKAIMSPYLAVYGRAEPRPAPWPSRRLREQVVRQQRAQVRLGFNPLPAVRALERLLGWEGGQ